MSAGDTNKPVEGSANIIDPAMSLVGKLEDLSLGEILQIVSLSRRSGLLRIEGPEGEGNVFIRDGKIIFASSSIEQEGVLSLLVSHGLVERTQIEGIRDSLEKVSSPDELKSVLFDELGVTPEAFQKTLRKKVEDMLYAFFMWEEGTFSFQLVENDDESPLFMRMGLLFLDNGISSQFIVMEGARIRDEKRRDQALAGGETSDTMDLGDQVDILADDTETAAAELQSFYIPESIPPLPERIAKVIILVTGDPALKKGITDALGESDINLLHFDDAVSTLVRIQELRTHRIFPYLILDMMAKGLADGVRLGGLDILSTLWDLGINLPASVIAFEENVESPRDDLVNLESVELILLPSLDAEDTSDDDSDQYQDEFKRLIERITEFIETKAEEDQEEYFDLERELSDDLESIDLPLDTWIEPDVQKPSEPTDPHMAKLSSFVAELNRQDISGEITLLALRFASEFASRAVLFLVRREDMRGLGQFGVDLGDELDADKMVRSLVLPRTEGSIFNKVIEAHQSYRGSPDDDEILDVLLQSLGGEIPGEFYVGPVISMGKAAVVLYCDDLPERQSIEPTQSLDIFLSHTGLALDRAFLEMKLKESG